MSNKITVKQYIKWAESQIGYKEHNNNQTKYSKELDEVNYYNTQKDPAHADWCAIFTDAGSYEVSGKDKKKALAFNYQPSKGNCGASCYYQYVYFKAKKRFFKTPKVGDKVIFGTKLAKGSIKHIGIVVTIDGKKIATVEGNKSNQVKKCTYTLGAKDSPILGFLRPKFDEDEKEPTKPVEKPKEETKPAAKKNIKASEPAASHDPYYAKSYKVTTSGKTLNMRDGAGTDYKVIAEIPNKAVVRCYGYYTGAWLFVRYETSSAIYEGFCSKAYLK